MYSIIDIGSNTIRLVIYSVSRSIQNTFFIKRIMNKKYMAALASYIDSDNQMTKAGFRIQIVIRGICCLLPGFAHETEHIEVHSIVGRYLEHSRIYIFGKGKDEKMYIASADFMTRNTER